MCETFSMSGKFLIEPAREQILLLAKQREFMANGIVSRTLLNAGQPRVTLFGFAQGQESSEHMSTLHSLIQI